MEIAKEPKQNYTISPYENSFINRPTTTGLISNCYPFAPAISEVKELKTIKIVYPGYEFTIEIKDKKSLDVAKELIDFIAGILPA